MLSILRIFVLLVEVYINWAYLLMQQTVNLRM